MEKEVNCINTKAILGYVKAQNNGDISGLFGDLDPFIDALPDPEAFLMDQNNWISSRTTCELLKRARLVLQDEMAVYKIAKFAIENSTPGYIQKTLVKAFWSTRKTLKNLQQINDKFNRSKRVELVEMKISSAIVRLHWNPGMELSKDLCIMNQGIYTFLRLIWGGSPVRLKETCCYFNGAPYCEYHLKWPARNRFHEIYSRFFTSKYVLKETIREMEEDKKIIDQKYEEVNKLNLELSQKIKQLQAIHETGKAILSILNLEQLLDVIMNTLANICQINRAIIMIKNEKEKCLEYLYASGFEKTIPEEVINYKVSLHRLNNILARVVSTGYPEYIPEVKNSSLRKDNIILVYGHPTSVFVVPLITRSNVIGVIASDAVDDSGIPKGTRETLEIFAPQIAIAIENARLYQKLQEQMAELRQSYALLSRAEKFSALGNLAARLAHEIKNPMTAIGTFLQMLPQRFDDEEYRGNFYQVALEETNRVNNLISELMDLVNTRESVFELNDIHELINRIVLLVSPQCDVKKVKIACHFDQRLDQVWLDSEKMKQVILNLLANAIDFTPEKGLIEIKTRVVRGKNMKKYARIEISDNGEGISPSMIDKVFDPYFTTKHKSNMHNGTGLGLFIVHQNMQDHGGSIEVKSEVNKGTTFILNLPLDYGPGSS